MSYEYRIGGWVGRLGNHLLQLSHAVFLAERYKGVCTFAEDDFLDNRVFDFSSGAPIEKTLWENFWEPNVKFTPDGREYAEDLHRERSRVLKTYILPLFKPYKKIDPGYDLVINIRGGDAFDDKSYPQYVQAPFSYFVAVIEKERPRNILVVAEDDRNPAVQLLRDSPYNIQVLSGKGAGHDANRVLNARVLVLGGVSTWHHVLSQMSPNLERVYYPEFGDGWELAPDELWKKDHWYREGNMLGEMEAEVVKVYFKDYVRIGKWDTYSTTQKLALVANHTLEKVYF
jgi:hypothetical protein